jgi:hypothetical protein
MASSMERKREGGRGEEGGRRGEKREGGERRGQERKMGVGGGMRLLFPKLSLKVKLYHNHIDHCKVMKENLD